MPLDPLTTQIVGSYSKPHWLARHSRMGTFDGSWWRPEPDVLEEAKRDATLLAVYEQERAGLDLVTDGEMRRSAYDRHFLHAFDGLDLTDMAEAASAGAVSTSRVVADGQEEFMRNLRLRPRVVRDLTWARSAALDELRFLKTVTRRPVKATVVGPLTLSGRVADDFYQDDEALTMALAAGLNEELRVLDREGVDLLQVDEPGFHFRLDLARLIGKQALTRLVEGVCAPVIVHVCYGYAIVHREKSASQIYPEVLEILSDCPIAGISLEYEQPRHEPSILRYCGAKHIVLGLLDLGTHRPEAPARIAERIRAALDVVSAERLHPCSDCGMWYLPREAAFAKIAALVAGTDTVRQELGLADRHVAERLA